MKGIILAAGKGTRMYPMTHPICKPLLPVYDKPLLYYPLAVLMQAGIREILIITPPDDMAPFIKLMGDGSELGLRISYRVQKTPRGIADAFMVGKQFIGDDDVCLVLGDNIFYGETLKESLLNAAKQTSGATVFGYYVDDPRPFGVVEFDENGKAVSIEEKPPKPKSNYVIPGLYFCDRQAIQFAEQVQPSARGELEITSVISAYLEQGSLKVIPLGEDFTWLDAGNADSLLSSAATIARIQKETGHMVACLEEIAYEMGFITKEMLLERAEELHKTNYGTYLKQFAETRK